MSFIKDFISCCPAWYGALVAALIAGNVVAVPVVTQGIQHVTISTTITAQQQ